MASAARSLQLCSRSCGIRRAAPFRGVSASSGAQALAFVRPFSYSAARGRKAAEEEDEDEDAAVEEDDGEWGPEDKLDPNMERALRKAIGEIKNDMSSVRHAPSPRVLKHSFWNPDEADPEMITDEKDEEESQEGDMLSLAHGKLDEHREAREYARLAVWDLPLLSKYAKSFEPPTADMPLRFRYTSYMGEFHPAERKVTLDFCPADLPLNDIQREKLKKLVGARYNPEKDIVHMGCEMFEHQAQNKRYLGDLVAKLIAEAKDPKDTFEDIPLDTRHHQFKTKPKFPREWRMTEERRKELQNLRREAFLLDETKRAEGSLVDGEQRIRLALESPKQNLSDRVAELVAAPAAPARGKAQRPSRR